MGGRNGPGDGGKPGDHERQEQQTPPPQNERPAYERHNIAEEIGLDGDENDNGRGLPD